MCNNYIDKYEEAYKETMELKEKEKSIHNINNTEGSYKFFYDESGNCRKFRLSENGFNVEYLNNFVLAGIMFKEYKDISNELNELYIDLKMQDNQKEIKSNYIMKNDFLASVKSKKLNKILHFIEDNNLYLHFSIRNNLYLFLVDIVDDSFNTYEEHSNHNFTNFYKEYERKLKSLLYLIVKDNIDIFIEFFNKFNYPDINEDQIYDFANEFMSILEDVKNTNNIDIYYYEKYGCIDIFQMYYECLISFLKVVKKTKKLLFLMNNERYRRDGDPFYETYLNRVFLFKNSKHIFDEEKEIIKVIDDVYPWVYNKFDLEFVDSQSEPLIQISDVIANFIYKFTNFLNAKSYEQLSVEVIDNINSDNISKENMKIFSKLVYKSINFSNGLYHYINSDYELDKFSTVIELFL